MSWISVDFTNIRRGRLPFVC